MKKLLLLFTIIFLCSCDSMYVEEEPVVYYQRYYPRYYYDYYYDLPRVIYRPRPIYVTPKHNTIPRRAQQHRKPQKLHKR